MRRRIVVLLCLLSLILPLSDAHADNRDLTVYIASGSKSAYRYHARSSCGSLSRSTVAETTLAEAAARGFTPCEKCQPPAPDFDVSATPRPETSSSGSSSTPTNKTSPPPYAAVSTPRATFRPSPRPSPTPTPAPEQTPEDKMLRGASVFCVVSLALSLCYLPLAMKLSAWRAEKQRIRAQQEKEEAERQCRIREEQEKKQAERLRREAEIRRQKEERERLARERWETERAELVALYGNRSSLECAGAPPGCALTPSGLPRGPDDNGFWGVDFTFYKTPHGRCFHKITCNYVVNRYDRIAFNAYEKNRYNLYACSCCDPHLPDMRWIEEYKRIVRLRKQYKIPEPAAEAEPSEPRPVCVQYLGI